MTMLTTHQYIQMTTSRRFDLLNVPAFSARSDIMALMPDKYVEQGELIPLTKIKTPALQMQDYYAGRFSKIEHAIEKLSHILFSCAGPQRFEPFNMYKVHKWVPSPRCIYPCQIQLLVRDNDANNKASRYYYHTHHHAIEYINTIEIDESLFNDDVDLVILGVGRFWMLADKYGDFTPITVALESGMLNCQIHHLCQSINWEVKRHRITPKTINSALHLNTPLESCLFALPVNTNDSISNGINNTVRPNKTTAIAKWRPTTKLLEQFTKLGDIASNFCTANQISQPRQPVTEIVAEPNELGKHDLFSAMAARHSGNDASGFLPISKNADNVQVNHFISHLRQLQQRRQLLPGEEYLNVSILWLNQGNTNTGIYRTDGSVSYFPDKTLKQVLTDSLPYAHLRYNLAELTFSLLIVADTEAADNTYGKDSLHLLHLSAGAIAQELSIVAALFGMFSRPIRMLKEDEIEQKLQLNGNLIYHVICGHNRSVNYAMELM